MVFNEIARDLYQNYEIYFAVDTAVELQIKSQHTGPRNDSQLTQTVANNIATVVGCHGKLLSDSLPTNFNVSFFKPEVNWAGTLSQYRYHDSHGYCPFSCMLSWRNFRMIFLNILHKRHECLLDFERLSASYVKVLGLQACPLHHGAHLHIHLVEPQKDNICDRNTDKENDKLNSLCGKIKSYSKSQTSKLLHRKYSEHTPNI